MNVRVTVGAGLLLVLLAGCSAAQSGRAAVSMVGGQLVIAVLGCEDGPDNVGVRVKGPEAADGTSELYGEWTRTEEMSRKTLFNPASPGDEWETIQALTTLDPAVDHYETYGFQAKKNAGRTHGVQFSAAELEALKPGSWLYSTEEYVDDTEEVRIVNKVTTDLDELMNSDDNGCG